MNTLQGVFFLCHNQYEWVIFPNTSLEQRPF